MNRMDQRGPYPQPPQQVQGGISERANQAQSWARVELLVSFYISRFLLLLRYTARGLFGFRQMCVASPNIGMVTTDGLSVPTAALWRASVEAWPWNRGLTLV